MIVELLKVVIHPTKITLNRENQAGHIANVFILKLIRNSILINTPILNIFDKMGLIMKNIFEP